VTSLSNGTSGQESWHAFLYGLHQETLAILSF